MSIPRLVGHRDFTDGPRRAVWEDAHCQYVEADDGEQVRGVWVLPEDEADVAVVVKAGDRPIRG